jgi:hypothetical protein
VTTQRRDVTAEAAVYICSSCRDDPGDKCDDYCGMDYVRELPPLWLEGFPSCECCGATMQLLRPLVTLKT